MCVLLTREVGVKLSLFLQIDFIHCRKLRGNCRVLLEPLFELLDILSIMQNTKDIEWAG